MSFVLYIMGFMVLMGGLIWAATIVGIPQTYIAVGAVILLGMGIMAAVSQTRRRDPSSGESDSVTVVKH